MHCLNIVRCMIVYLDCINIMRFQKKLLLLLLSNDDIEACYYSLNVFSQQKRSHRHLQVNSMLSVFLLHQLFTM